MPKRKSIKKNRSPTKRIGDETPRFFESAGVAGRRYEQLRMAALDGNETDDSWRWGMIMVVPEYAPADGELWTVTRARASIRAGEVSVKELFDELGVLTGLAGSAINVESRTVVVS